MKVHGLQLGACTHHFRRSEADVWLAEGRPYALQRLLLLHRTALDEVEHSCLALRLEVDDERLVRVLRDRVALAMLLELVVLPELAEQAICVQPLAILLLLAEHDADEVRVPWLVVGRCAGLILVEAGLQEHHAGRHAG